MLATLTGTVTEKLADQVILDVRGVGYGLLVTNEDFHKLDISQAVKVYIYEHIREQSYDLFGFSTLDAKHLFEQLLGVSGIGPKMALSVLSIGNRSEVRSAIAGGDVRYIQTAPGVGKRVAERIVVELKDKVGLGGVDLAETGILSSSAVLSQDEAVSALISLGYSLGDAVNALKNIDSSLTSEERLSLALKGKP